MLWRRPRLFAFVCLIVSLPALVQPAAGRLVMRCEDGTVCTPEMMAAARSALTDCVAQIPVEDACCGATPTPVEQLSRGMRCEWTTLPSKDFAKPYASALIGPAFDVVAPTFQQVNAAPNPLIRSSPAIDRDDLPHLERFDPRQCAGERAPPGSLNI